MISQMTTLMTAAIDYTNGEPHIGHVYEKILADVLLRYHRLAGRDTTLVIGTDEHGEKISKAAAAAGISPQQLVDQLSVGAFQKLWKDLDVKPDHFIRTTDERHKAHVRDVLQRVYETGDIYFSEYGGLYSVGAERYVTEKELVLGEDGIKRFPGDKDPPEMRTEGNYFFKMSKYQDWLLEYLKNHPDLIQPIGFRNEVLEMLKEPIEDLSISRPKSRVDWGIELPWDSEHVTYVWFDALLSYLTPFEPDQRTSLEATAHHLIGKDILKPHAIFWPTMLRALGLPMYSRLIVHSHILAEDGRKMGKSLGNSIDPAALIEKYSADTVRYVLLSESSLGADSQFGEGILAARVNSDLADSLGNLLSRTLAMVHKYKGGVVPAPNVLGEREQQIEKEARALPAKVMALVDDLKLNMAIAAAMNFVRDLNRYIAESAPWKLAKQHDPHLDTVLYTALEGIRIASVVLEPVIPSKAKEIRRQLGLSQEYSLTEGWGLLPADTRVEQGTVLFPKIEHKPETASKGLKEGSQKNNAIPQEKPMSDNQTPTPETTPETTPEASTPALISIDEFAKIDLRIVEVIACEAVEKADKLLKLTVKLGDEERTVVSGIRKWFEPADLVGRKVVLVANLKPAKLRGIMSQGMILAAENAEGQLDLLGTHIDMPSGTQVR